MEGISKTNCFVVFTYFESPFLAEKVRWEIINSDTLDDLVPKPRAGHCAVSVSDCCRIIELEVIYTRPDAFILLLLSVFETA